MANINRTRRILLLQVQAKDLMNKKKISKHNQTDINLPQKKEYNNSSSKSIMSLIKQLISPNHIASKKNITPLNTNESIIKLNIGDDGIPYVNDLVSKSSLSYNDPFANTLSKKHYSKHSNDLLAGGIDQAINDNDIVNHLSTVGYNHELLRLNSKIDHYLINFANNKFELKHKQSGHVNAVNNVELFDFNGQYYTSSELRKRSQRLKKYHYHSFNGAYNNIDRPNIGKVNSALRLLTPIQHPKILDEKLLPNPRAISDIMAKSNNPDQPNHKKVNDLFWVWGQFINNTINLIPSNKDDITFINIPSIKETNNTTEQRRILSHRLISTTINNKKHLINAVSPYIDGSNIYGSDKATSDSLRSFIDGRLLIGDHNLLPNDDNQLFISGDSRSNENIALSAMHTLWLREHNRVADQLADKHPSWNEEKLFQETRKNIIEKMQYITYNEFIPQLLGDIKLSPYEGYNSTVSPQLSESFALAAFNISHSMLPNQLLRLNKNNTEIKQGHIELKNAFFHPEHVTDAGITPILRGLISQIAQKINPVIHNDLRNFPLDNNGSLFDHAAVMIQRGRDHGLTSYNQTREALGLATINDFNDPIFDSESAQNLSQIYKSTDDIDLWVGGLSEKPTNNALVGTTFAHIIKEQFEHIRDGDRFWYENNTSATQPVTLAGIIENNTKITISSTHSFQATNQHSKVDNMIASDSSSNRSVSKEVNRILNPLPVSNLMAEVLAEDALRSGSQQ